MSKYETNLLAFDKWLFLVVLGLGSLRALGVKPLVPRVFLEGHCFFSKLWRRIEGGRN